MDKASGRISRKREFESPSGRRGLQVAVDPWGCGNGLYRAEQAKCSMVEQWLNISVEHSSLQKAFEPNVASDG